MRIVKLNGAGAIQLRLAIDRAEKFGEIERGRRGLEFLYETLCRSYLLENFTDDNFLS
jgi:hypothetical protein